MFSIGSSAKDIPQIVPQLELSLSIDLNPCDLYLSIPSRTCL